MPKPDQLNPTGLTVLITAGEFAGEEGVCLGLAIEEKDQWAVSPGSSDRIVNLRFDEEFGILINPAQESGKN